MKQVTVVIQNDRMDEFLDEFDEHLFKIKYFDRRDEESEIILEARDGVDIMNYSFQFTCKLKEQV